MKSANMRRRRGSSGAADPVLLFNAFDGSAGVAQLPAALTVNSVLQTPVFRYYGSDATTAQITAQVGETLPVVGSGAAVAPDLTAPGLGANDYAVQFTNAANGKHFRAAAGSFADITTEDITGEMVFKTDTSVASTSAIFSKRLTTPFNGYVAFLNASLQLIVTLDAGAVHANTISAALTGDTWYHAIWFADKSGSCQIYINGVASGAAVDISGVGDITNAQKFEIGQQSSASYESGVSLAYVGLWKGTLNSHTQTALAAERFHQWAGTYPTTATGTYAPTAATRASSAYLNKYNTTSSQKEMVYVGAGCPRSCYEIDGSATKNYGILLEPEDENELTYSNDFTDAAWVKTRCAMSVATTEGPDPYTTAKGIVGTAVDNTHYLLQNVGGGAQDIFSVYAKPGDRDWVLMTISIDPQDYAYFDVANGVVGTVGTNVTSTRIDGPYNNGFYRCSMTYAGAGAHTHAIAPCDADADNTYNPDGSSVNLWIYEANHTDKGFDMETSSIDTVAAAATRVTDVLYFKGDDGNVAAGQGKMTFDFLIPEGTYSNGHPLVRLSDGGSTDEEILVQFNATTGYLNLTVTDSTVVQANITGSTDVADGDWHSVEVQWSASYFNLLLDTVSQGTDLAGTVPTGLDRIDVTPTNTKIISDLKIYDKA